MYLADKKNDKLDIVYMEYDLNGYEFKPKNKLNGNYISVDKVNIVDDNFISYLIARKFDLKFNKLSNIILDLVYQDDDDTDEGDLLVLLDETARLRSVVEIKYKKHLDNEEYRKYMSKIAFLDQQIREKIAILNYQRNIETDLNIGRSR